MVDQAATEDIGGGTEAKPSEGGKSGKALVLFVVLPILLVLGGATGAYLGGLLDPLLGAEEEHQEEVPVAGESVFYDLPDMLVNISGGGRKASYLKISVSLELENPAALERVDQVLPRIVDSFQVYLRELRIEDLDGSAGLQRLREELLLRVNTAVQPVVVRDVLFKEMLIQ